MRTEFNNQTPLFTQLAEGIEDAILADIYREEDQIPSTTEMALSYGINPATALKGVNLLVEEGVVFKKRGLGMFVSTGAKQKIHLKRKEAFLSLQISALLEEARKLNISREELISMIKEARV